MPHCGIIQHRKILIFARVPMGLPLNHTAPYPFDECQTLELVLFVFFIILVKREKIERNCQRKREKERHTHPIASGGGEDVVEAGVNKVEADGVQGAFPFLQAVGNLIFSSLLSRHQISHHRLRPDASCPRCRCLCRSRCLECHRHSLLCNYLSYSLVSTQPSSSPTTSSIKRVLTKISSSNFLVVRIVRAGMLLLGFAFIPQSLFRPHSPITGPAASHSSPIAHEGIRYSYNYPLEYVGARCIYDM